MQRSLVERNSCNFPLLAFLKAHAMKKNLCIMSQTNTHNNFFMHASLRSLQLFFIAQRGKKLFLIINNYLFADKNCPTLYMHIYQLHVCDIEREVVDRE